MYISNSIGLNYHSDFNITVQNGKTVRYVMISLSSGTYDLHLSASVNGSPITPGVIPVGQTVVFTVTPPQVITHYIKDT